MILLLALALRALAADPDPTVFIHGIKGSILESADGRVRWITRAEALGLSSPDLALPMRWEADGTQARDGLRAVRPIDRVTIVPGLVKADVYGEFMGAMPEPFYPFAYDWRRDNHETVPQFEAFLAEVRARHPGRKLRLVAHSNGGLVSWVVLNEHPDWFSSAWFAGVPFAGGVGFLPDLAVGQREGLNSRVLRPEVLGTFPLIYGFFRDPEYFQVETWKENRWGIFAGAAPAGAETFLARALESAARFRQLLVPRPEGGYPELHVIRSRAHPTLQAIGKKPDGSPDFESEPRCEGDGRVCAEDALLPGGVAAAVHETQADHAGLLSSAEALALLR